MGTSPRRIGLVRVQVEVVPAETPGAAPLRLRAQPDGRFLPRRYALVALPATDEDASRKCGDR